ncbi:phage tail protein [Streptomyces yerevanensis]|uniref:phage tail protein n=1 Tax=Streptomyces yerevanensis TaxID=66378 RepID=UPI0006896FE9|nr:phage tail protein [Streptomyces yerevanensis]
MDVRTDSPTHLLLDSASGWRPATGSAAPLPEPVRDGDALVLPPDVTEAALVTIPLDSGISRCRWHRVRVVAEVPSGSALVVQLATTGDDPVGVPGPDDWQTVAGPAYDVLVDQPPGRYLVVRLLLGRGDAATAGPAVRQLRLDLPRATSADLLPAVYREDPTADDFTERFLALFDSVVETLDRATQRAPALLDPAGVPEDVLPWIAGLLGLDPGTENVLLSPAVLRELIAAAPELRRRRGTPHGLALALEIVLGVRPAVLEPVGPPWGAVGRDTRLGEVRLFGRSATRVRLGGPAVLGSRLAGVGGRSGAPLRSLGEPADDPLTGSAFRFRVLLPPHPDTGVRRPGALDGLATTAADLVERLSPAHTTATVSLGGLGFTVGERSAVGVDTLLVGPAPSPSGRAVLGVDTLLGPDRSGRRGIRLDGTSGAGIRTVVLDEGGTRAPADEDTASDETDAEDKKYKRNKTKGRTS